MSLSASDQREIAKKGARSTVLGWTAQQWAWAAAFYGIQGFETFSQVEVFRRQWEREQRLDPGPGLIELPEYRQNHPGNPRAAYDAFRLYDAYRVRS